MKDRNKIFNIGFHKTGTTSLTHFMRDNGYRTLHNTAYSMQRLGLGNQGDVDDEPAPPVNMEDLLDMELVKELVQEFDFFSDNPWPLIYKLLDRNFPGSKFILTRRNTDSWINSLTRYSDSQKTRMRQLIYGYGNPENHITRYRKVYIRHNKEVARYFDDRTNLLVIDIEEDNQKIAESLAMFLGLGDNPAPFPTANKS